MDNVDKFKQALREAAHANGTPVPFYYDDEMQIQLYQERADRVSKIIVEALKD